MCVHTKLLVKLRLLRARGWQMVLPESKSLWNTLYYAEIMEPLFGLSGKANQQSIIKHERHIGISWCFVNSVHKL